MAQAHQDWFATSFVADGTPPTLALGAPANGATVAAPVLQLSATASDAVDAGGMPRDNLARVYFLVDDQVISATRQAGAIPAPGQAQAWAASAPVGAGSHTVRAVAVDRAGNEARSGEAGVTVSLATHLAGLVSPPSGGTVAASQVSLVGYASFLDEEGSGQVEVLVDGVSQGMARLDSPLARLSRCDSWYERMFGIATASTIPPTVTVTMSSSKVKPSVRRIRVPSKTGSCTRRRSRAPAGSFRR